MITRSRGSFVAALSMLAVVLALTASAGTAAVTHSVSSSIKTGASLSGSVSWTATSSDPASRVEFYIDGVRKWMEGSSPYVFNGDGKMLDTKTLSNGGHTLKVTAFYSDGQSASESASVTVSNGVAHSVASSIVNGASLSGSVSWTATSSDPPSRVDFYIDSVRKWTESSSPYVFNGDGKMLDTKTLVDGGHTLRVTAVYPDGQSASASASVTVSNLATAPAPAPAPAPTPAPASSAIGIPRFGSSYSTSSNYDRYNYIIAGPADASKAGALTAKSLIYESAADIPKTWSAGVSYQQALANGWLLKDSSGNYLKSKGYDTWVADVGSAGYRQAWLTNVTSLLTTNKADGVFIDTVIADLRTLTSGVNSPKYPTQLDWENAMAGFIAYIGPPLKAKGFQVVPSALKRIYNDGSAANNDGSRTAEWWRRLGPSVSGLFTEYFVQQSVTNAPRALGVEWWNHYDGWQGLVSVAQGLGVDFFGWTYASMTDTRMMRYAKASLYLDWNGRGGGLFIECSCSDPWSSAWTANIGAPLESKVLLRTGVWKRNYSNGTVVLNATLSTVTVSVNGTSRTLGPTDALILTS